MITDSSKDYTTGQVLMTFEGEIPTYEEVNQYCFDNYGFRPNFDYSVEPQTVYKGFTNSGTVVAHAKNG